MTVARAKAFPTPSEAMEVREGILDQLAREDRGPTFDERATLHRLGLSDDDVAAEIRRVKRVAVFCDVVVSRTEIEAAKQRAADAQSKLQEEGPRLREVIGDAERKLHELERAAAKARDRQTNVDLAVGHLRSPELLPLSIRHDAAMAERILLAARQELADAGWHMMSRLQLCEFGDRYCAAIADGLTEAQFVGAARWFGNDAYQRPRLVGGEPVWRHRQICKATSTRNAISRTVRSSSPEWQSRRCETATEFLARSIVATKVCWTKRRRIRQQIEHQDSGRIERQLASERLAVVNDQLRVLTLADADGRQYVAWETWLKLADEIEPELPAAQERVQQAEDRLDEAKSVASPDRYNIDRLPA